jgi:hypothetical protein
MSNKTGRGNEIRLAYQMLALLNDGRFKLYTP